MMIPKSSAIPMALLHGEVNADYSIHYYFSDFLLRTIMSKLLCICSFANIGSSGKTQIHHALREQMRLRSGGIAATSHCEFGQDLPQCFHISVTQLRRLHVLLNSRTRCSTWNWDNGR